MIVSDIPSTDTKREMQMLSEAKQESWSQPALVPTPQDRLVVAIVSLVVLVLCAVLMFGASSVLHAGTIGWLATLVVILFAVITINVVMALGSSHLKRLHERAG